MQMEQLGLFKKVRVYIDTAKGKKLMCCDRRKTCEEFFRSGLLKGGSSAQYAWKGFRHRHL